MRILSTLNDHKATRRSGLQPFAGLFFALFLAVMPWSVHASQQDKVRIEYFFSMTCSHCIEARPAVIALSKRYPLEGRNVGTVAADGYPFPIKPADKKQSKEVYGIKGVPALAVFINNVFRQKISGANDIQDARIIVQALADKAMTVTEAAKITNTNEYIITGWLMARGQYFKSSQYYLSDRTTDIPVKAWLPTESVKRPQSSTGPRLMASVVRKPVILKGNFQKTEAGTLFVVKEELPVD